ncbi:MAG TPA: GAF domain-containing protein [Solirubrobacterales bacterium]|jgi:GAF domain-containing protein
MPSVRGVVENVLAALVVAGLAWAVSHIDASIELWVAVLLAAAALLVGYRLGGSRRIPKDLASYQADLLRQAILALRDFEAGRLKISLEDFVERGILGPACFGLSTVGGEQIRMSVLKLDDSGQSFRMLYQSGHSLGRKDNFDLPRASLAGQAFDTQKLQWIDDVAEDQRWLPHPKASDRRSYRSLASMPIVVGDKAVAVLNVLSTEKAAFLKGDLTYIELLGGLIALVWALHSSADSSATLASESSDPTKGT